MGVLANRRSTGRRAFALLFSGYWSFYAVVLTAMYLPAPFLTPWGAVLSALGDAASLIIVWLAAYASATYLPLRPDRRLPRNLLLTLVAASTVILLRIVLLRTFLGPLGWFGGSLADSINAMLFRNLITFAIFWAGGWALAQHQKASAIELRVATLRLRLVEARLAVLTEQLHPHFIGNALNTVASFIGEAPGAARATLANLRRIIAAARGHADSHEVKLAEELAFVDDWLALQQHRFGERLVVRSSIQQGTADAWVPPLILQPLVENVVKHAVVATNRAVSVTISAWAASGTLHLTVHDDGPGPRPQASGRRGIGLANTTDRLELMYPGAAGLQLKEAEGGGTLVHIHLPLRFQRMCPDSEQQVREVESAGSRDATPGGVGLPPRDFAILLMGCLAIIAAVGLAAFTDPGLSDIAWKVLRLLTVAVLPALIAYRLPQWLSPDSRRTPAARWAVLAAAALALAVLAIETAMFGLGAALAARRPLWDFGAAALSAVNVWTMQLNVLAAVYLSRRTEALQQGETELRRSAAHLLEHRYSQMESGSGVETLDETLLEVDGLIPGDSEAALSLIADLSARLARATEAATAYQDR